jgi:hypothetical protein
MTLDENHIVTINTCIERFITNAINLGAEQINTPDHQSTTATIEQIMLDRLTTQTPRGIVVKRIYDLTGTLYIISFCVCIVHFGIDQINGKKNFFFFYEHLFML